MNHNGFTAPLRGFSLIEVLVALLVLGCVVFGFVTLALRTSQQVGEVSLRAQAHILARDLIERIHANPLAWPHGFLGANPQAGLCSVATPCSDPLSMAAQDLAESRALAAQSLPQGEISAHSRCGEEAPTPCVVVAWQGASAQPGACLQEVDGDDPHCLLLHFWPTGAP